MALMMRAGLAIELETAMDAGHDEVEALEDLVRIVEGAVDQDVGFNPLQDPEPLAEGSVQPVGFAVLLLDLFERKPARIVRRLGVVRDTEVVEAAFAGRFRHFIESLGAVGGVGVTVQNAAQVVVSEELRKIVLQCSFDLPTTLAQLRFDKGHTEGAVDVLLLGAFHAAALVQPVRLKPHTLPLREGPELVQMLRRPCRMQQRRSEMLAVR